jgi:hypothetical protein
MSTFSFADSDTFTETHAAHHAGRITTDLRHCFQEYGSPAEHMLEQYLEELKILLKRHLVSDYHFGFERANVPVWGMHYEITQHGDVTAESDIAGGIPRGRNVAGASFFNFLTYSTTWSSLNPEQRSDIEAMLPFSRTTGVLPGSGSTVYISDRQYNAGGIGTQRSVFGGAV